MLQALRMDLLADAESFFREFYPRLYRFVLGRTGAPHAEVEEIVQDVLLHAWRDRATFRGDASPIAWLIGIARHRVSERRRARDRRARAEEILRALRRIDAELVPDDLVEQADLRARVRCALERIDPAYALVLKLRYLDDLAVPAIASRLGESDKAVESRLHRAREAFRAQLVSEEEDEPTA